MSPEDTKRSNDAGSDIIQDDVTDIAFTFRAFSRRSYPKRLIQALTHRRRSQPRRATARVVLLMSANTHAYICTFTWALCVCVRAFIEYCWCAPQQKNLISDTSYQGHNHRLIITASILPVIHTYLLLAYAAVFAFQSLGNVGRILAPVKEFKDHGLVISERSMTGCAPWIPPP